MDRDRDPRHGPWSTDRPVTGGLRGVRGEPGHGALAEFDDDIARTSAAGVQARCPADLLQVNPRDPELAVAFERLEDEDERVPLCS